jgi:hypothetical protein
VKRVNELRARAAAEAAVVTAEAGAAATAVVAVAAAAVVVVVAAVAVVAAAAAVEATGSHRGRRGPSQGSELGRVERRRLGRRSSSREARNPSRVPNYASAFRPSRSTTMMRRPSLSIRPLRLNCDRVNETVSRVEPIKFAIS